MFQLTSNLNIKQQKLQSKYKLPKLSGRLKEKYIYIFIYIYIYVNPK